MNDPVNPWTLEDEEEPPSWWLTQGPIVLVAVLVIIALGGAAALILNDTEDESADSDEQQVEAAAAPETTQAPSTTTTDPSSTSSIDVTTTSVATSQSSSTNSILTTTTTSVSSSTTLSSTAASSTAAGLTATTAASSTTEETLETEFATIDESILDTSELDALAADLDSTDADGTTTSSDATGSTAGAAETLTEVGLSFPNPETSDDAAGSGCDVSSGPLPDGTWFGRIQRTDDAPTDSGFWGDDEIQLGIRCLYGGDAASELAAERLDEIPPGPGFYSVKDVAGSLTIPRADDAQARELLDLTGTAGPAVAWDEGQDEFSDIAGTGCCADGWVRTQGGVVVEIAIIREGGTTQSFRRPPGAECTDNGFDLDSSTLIRVDSVPADAADDELSVYLEPGFGADPTASLPVGTQLNVLHRCEVNVDGSAWWLLDLEGQAVWGLADHLVADE